MIERLHKEVLDFYDFVRPDEYEVNARRTLINRVENAINECRTVRNIDTRKKDIRVKSFGSFAAGLYLPTADMDLVAVSPRYLGMGQKVLCQTGGEMHKLRAWLCSNASALAEQHSAVAITRAKVPIIKFVDRQTGIKVDVSFENDSGLIGNRTFEEWKAKFPAMPTLVMLIKQLLAMRGLNDVFTGGLGGFSTICLVVSMMQLMPEIQSGNMDPRRHYSDLLLNFLDLYGNKLDIVRTGITMDPPGYFDKTRTKVPRQNEEGLTIIDPNRPDNDISGGSRNINAVLNCFRSAHASIQRRLDEVNRGKDVNGSILGCVLGGNYDIFTNQRNKLRMASQPAPKRQPPWANKGCRA